MFIFDLVCAMFFMSFLKKIVCVLPSGIFGYVVSWES